MIHPRELEILNILWGSDKALTSLEITKAGKELSQSTVQVTLRKFLREGFVVVDEITHSGNVLSRSYRPTEKTKDLVLQQFVEQYKEISNIVTVEEAEAALQKMKGEEHE